MQEIIIAPCLDKASAGNPARRMVVQGRDVRALFTRDKTTAIGAQLKEALLDSYLKGVNNTNIA